MTDTDTSCRGKPSYAPVQRAVDRRDRAAIELKAATLDLREAVRKYEDEFSAAMGGRTPTSNW